MSEPKPITNLRNMRALVNNAAMNEGAEKIVRHFIAGVAQNREAPISLIVAMANVVLDTRIDELIDAGLSSTPATPDSGGDAH